MIYYLAHPYGQYTDKEQTWEYAREWTEKLRSVGCIVFSPILHTHCYDINRKMNFKEDYLDWDLKIIEGFMDKPSWGIMQKYNQGVTILMSNTAWGLVSTFDEDPMLWFSKGCEKEYKFAKENDIRVLRLEEFLEGKEIEI